MRDEAGWLAAAPGLRVNQNGARRTVSSLFARVDLGAGTVASAFSALCEVALEILVQIARDEGVGLPLALDHTVIRGLSAELRNKLERARPATLGQAARIEWITPTALIPVLLRMRRLEARSVS